MAKRKIVLLVVEGTSDANLLVPAFSALIEHRRFQGQEFHCDVLTAPNHSGEFYRSNGFYPADNPSQTVRELVEHYLKDRDYTWSQLGHVLQICDLDGAFTPDDCVVENPAAGGTQYSTTGIITRNRTALVADRTIKRNGVNTLLKFSGFKKKSGRSTLMIPYRLFYVSRNLEHAFLGRIDNLDARHKQSGAIKLANRFTKDPSLFATTLQSLRRIHGNPETWEESWRYAMQDLHSLERGSNLAFVEPYLAGE
ncbi:hypothetical protein CS006_03325 [Bifidobacterium primatium]|uniref:Uncharacterized protein n=1 Tax=Bifidobacterium primatium TaxID=2045438 RepID=A0A2M9HBH9_9BIFI|nr:hypothetical protein [Bifidobacterium primatium]PJM74174.1 hypothetical protein CS006_03325 [Bifidobacterium primatium]